MILRVVYNEIMIIEVMENDTSITYTPDKVIVDESDTIKLFMNALGIDPQPIDDFVEPGPTPPSNKDTADRAILRNIGLARENYNARYEDVEGRANQLLDEVIEIMQRSFLK